MRRLLFLVAVLPLAACTSDTAPPVAPPPVAPQASVPQGGPGHVLSFWEQLGPGGVLEARAITGAAACPWIVSFKDYEARQRTDTQMTMRAPATGEFPMICAAPVPDGQDTVWIADTKQMGDAYQFTMERVSRSAALVPYDRTGQLARLRQDPERILVIGDTGCRLKGSLVQPCNSPTEWPFPNIAQHAAALRPDLVIHVGDYLYRENACPAGNAGCQGTPFGDNWPTWAADFFTPAQPLLAAAPWVFVRGNHEDCQRAGPGWTRLLAPAPFDPANICADHTPPFSMPLKPMTLVVMDNAAAPDTAVDASAVPAYRKELTDLGSHTSPVWLLMHRPVWAAISGPLGVPIGGNATMIEAAGKDGIPKPVELQIAGHIHTFEAINYKDKVPPQILAGGGGDLLDKTPEDLKGAIFQGSSGVSVKDGLSINGFSYLFMTKAAAGWDIAVLDQDGALLRKCTFAGGRVDCPAPTK
jgi:hypothetical protein